MSHLRQALCLIRADFDAIKRDLRTAFAASLAVGAVFGFIPITIDALVDGYLLAQSVLLPVLVVLGLGAIAYGLFSVVQQRSLHRIRLVLSAGQYSRLLTRLMNVPLTTYRQYPSLSADHLSEYVELFTPQVAMPPIYLLILLGEWVGLVTTVSLWNSVILWIPVLVLLAVVFAVTERYLYLALRERQRTLHLTTLSLLRHIPKFHASTVTSPLLAYWQQQHTSHLSASRLYTVIGTVSRWCLAAFPLIVVITAMPLSIGTAFGLFWLAKKAADMTHLAISWYLALSAMREFILLVSSSPESQKGSEIHLTGHIKIEQITFRHTPLAAPVLDNVSLEVYPGECVAIIGSSGAGKTTLLKLLMGLDTPESGRILFDGQDSTELSQGALHAQIGMVSQNSRLEPGSLWMNISAFTPVPIERAWEAAKRANIDHVIRALASGMHTLIDKEGAIFSQGQGQRLLLARALVNNPTILLLDEATSAVDDETQSAIFNNLRGVTRILVTGRLSAVRCADRIYVLHEGHIVESGEFEKLINQNGMFAELMRRQQA